jgi:hypothetical protein
MGAYLDRETGALLSYAIGKMAGNYVNAHKDSPRETGLITKAGLKYGLVRVPDARARHAARLRDEVGPSFGTMGTFEALLPPANSVELVVSIPADGFSYNFTAWVCGDDEEQRIRELLLGQEALLTEEPTSRGGELAKAGEKGKTTSRSRGDTRSCDTLEKGASLASVLNSLGTPESVFRPRCGIPALFYRATLRGKTRVCRLEFNDQQRLAAKELRE